MSTARREYSSAGYGQDAVRLHAFLLDVFYAGSLGTIAKVVTAPIDRAKLVLQTQAAHRDLRHFEGFTQPGAERRTFRHSWDVVCTVVRKENARALWAGNMAHCLRFIPQQSSAIVLNDQIHRVFGPAPEAASPTRPPKTSSYDVATIATSAKRHFQTYLAGGVAGVASATLCHPLDVAHTALATRLRTQRFGGIMDCLTATVRGEAGVAGLFTGWTAGAAAAFVFYFITFGIVDVVSTRCELTHATWPSTSFAFAVGFAARSIPTVLVYPLETISRQMMMWAEVPPHKRPEAFRSPLACRKALYRSGGVRAFYAGAGPEVAKAAATLGCFGVAGWLLPA